MLAWKVLVLDQIFQEANVKMGFISCIKILGNIGRESLGELSEMQTWPWPQVKDKEKEGWVEVS